MKVVFEKESSLLREILFKESESLAESLDVIGKPLIVHNLAKITAAYRKVERAFVPEGFPRTIKAAQRGVSRAWRSRNTQRLQTWRR